MTPCYYFENGSSKGGGHEAYVCLFLDFDGTLAPIQNDPDKCILAPQIRDMLVALADSNRCDVVVLSGRSLPDITKKVDLDGIYYGGNHGLIISGPDASFIHPDAAAVQELIRRARIVLEEAISTLEGVWIEDKGLSFTLHYRLAPKELAGRARKAFHNVVSTMPHKGLLKTLKGKKVLELMPNVEWDKGKAVLFLLGRLKEESTPFYIGDDYTDESAFNVLAGRGITVRVGSSRKTAARYFLKGQWEITRFLRDMCDMVGIETMEKISQN